MLKQLAFALSLFIVSGCATLDKAMAPIDKGINSAKTAIQKIGHSIDETINDLGNTASGIKSDLLENSLAQTLLSDNSIMEHRLSSFVVWKSASRYKLDTVFKKILKEHDIKNHKLLGNSEKMIFLKDYFFEMQKKRHAEKFSNKHTKPLFDEFLTDRENIKKIHEYKAALLDSEHQWKIDLKATQKKVAELMLSTLYADPVLKYVSYDPYKEEIYYTIEAKNGGFKQKIKLESDKKSARMMKEKTSSLKPFVFYKFDSDVLAFVGVAIEFDGKALSGVVVDNTYVRDSNVVFTSDEISLDNLNVRYYDIVKNVKPPKWFNNIDTESNQLIGYGEGINKDDAKKEAFKEIAMSIKTVISSTIESEKTVSGSTKGEHSKSSTKQLVEDVSIKGSKVLKVEKKDGLWFVAILHKT